MQSRSSAASTTATGPGSHRSPTLDAAQQKAHSCISLSVIRHNKVFKNQILIKNKESLIFLLQRNKLKLALPQILFHNAPMLHCNIELAQS
ncbi:hypothetical protein [Comamonas sp. AG1104]|uniref:hypothetical protein n=1 Tax=Comamonas sp. AG1104 TaxID=2183900 RepID=UPI001F1B9DF5|nr:hypothetical protein [Comamonas sp. AG1104]